MRPNGKKGAYLQIMPMCFINPNNVCYVSIVQIYTKSSYYNTGSTVNSCNGCIDVSKLINDIKLERHFIRTNLPNYSVDYYRDRHLGEVLY